MDPKICAQMAQFLCTFSDVFSISEWDVAKHDFVEDNVDVYPSFETDK